MKDLIVLTDSGDTFIDESSQVFDERGIVLDASFVPHGEETLRKMVAMGYTVSLVADGETESFENVFKKHGFWDVFKTRTISQEVGIQKPARQMFDDAFRKLGLTEEDKPRVVMVGNNLRKDVLGANNYGIISIWVKWSPRYFHEVRSPEEQPTYSIDTIDQLPDLLSSLH